MTNGAGYTVTYQAVADPAGSINTTSIGKGNFYTYTPFLYGPLAPDMGLAGWAMPGPANTPAKHALRDHQPARRTASPPRSTGSAPRAFPSRPTTTPGNKNPYPLMRMIARNGANQPIATNDIVLPVSDEMDCRACHASGTQAAAKPAAGWVWDGLPERDYRLNILRLHDERQFALHATVYAAALADARLTIRRASTAGVTADGKPVLCALCHASEALRTPRLPGDPAADDLGPLAATPTSWIPMLKHHAGQRRQPRRLLPLPSRLDDHVACAARWAARSPPTARWRCSARAATAT